MNPVLWGLVTAFSWGTADFIARFTGRALGHGVALAGMLAASALALSAIAVVLDLDWRWDGEAWWLVGLTGLGIAGATLLLYWGLARGPVTVVAPIVGAYPAFNLVIAVASGARPPMLAWAAMGVVMAGVAAVAAASGALGEGTSPVRRRTRLTAVAALALEPDRLTAGTRALRATVLIALASSVGFALAIAALGEAAARYGELQAVMAGRWVSLAAALAYLAVADRRRPRIAGRWWLILVLQGVLDGAAYMALALGARGPDAVAAVVVASAFAAVTVVLARAILKEPMTRIQWGGVALIAAGVAVLSALR
jgi:drug/metabolite transporter (DMT)-like permease